MDFCKAVKNINKWRNVQEKQSKRVLTRNIFNVPLRLNQRITVSKEEMLRYLLWRDTSVSIREKRSESIKEEHFGICGWKMLWHLWLKKYSDIYGWKILQYLGETLWCLWGISLDPCELFTKVSVSFYQITQFDSWFLFTINKCVNTCYHRTQYITVNFWNGPMNI